MMLDLRLAKAGERDAVAGPWRELHERVDPRGLATSWEWTTAWLDQWGGDIEHWFALAERDGVCVGAALLTRERPRLAVLRGRALHVGTAGEPPEETVFVEHNRLLCAESDRAAFAAALVSATGRIAGWERLALDGVSPADAADLAAAADGMALRTEECPYRDLAAVRAAGGDVRASLRGSVRRRVGQSERVFGDLTTEWASDADEALAVLDELVALHDARWQRDGLPGAFSTPRIRAFHRAALARLLPLERAIAIRVRAGSRTVGCLLCYVDRNDVLFYQSGFASFEDNRLRPGLVTHVAALQACADRGFDAYDFLAGAARYKDELSDATRPLVWGTLARPTVRGCLSRLAHAAHDRAKTLRDRK